MINIIKRDGRVVPYDVEKLHIVLERACEDLDGVSPSEIIEHSKIQFTDNMKTSRIQEIMINAAANLISVDKPNYQYVAARLKSYDLRQRVYGEYYPPALIDIFRKNIDLGIYDAGFLVDYSQAEFDQLQAVINHKRDKRFTWAAMVQLTEKYLLQNRAKKSEGIFYETPQVMYMAIAMALFSKWNRVERMDMVTRFYDYASTGKFSLPTPIMAGVRTRTRQFSSCVLIKVGDTLDSIKAAGSAIVDYVSKRAGIGLDVGEIRALGAPIRGGEMEHTGTIPFIKKFVGDLKSCSQGGVRGGSMTAYYPMWHLQFPAMIVLKNNRGTENNRERRTDYGVQINRVMMERAWNKQNIYLFDPAEVKKMFGPLFYSSYFNDVDTFRDLYDQAIKAAEQGMLRHECLPADEVWGMLLDQRSDTGRIYIEFCDNMNKYSPFTQDTVWSSNLCCEIALPTRAFEQYDDPNGRIALCTLASLNMTAFDDPKDIEDVAYVLVAALDSLLEYQDYPCIQAREAVVDYRPLGIGIVNLAHFLAKNFCSYGSPEGLRLVDEWMAHLHFYLMKASNRLAMQFGKCRMPTIHDEGKITPDLFERKIVGERPEGNAYGLDWDGLRADLKKHGIRNATLLAIAPTESSSQVLNATNGIEPPKGPMTSKGSKNGVVRQLVPDIETLKDVYDYKWDIQCAPYLMTSALLQYWVDQAISTNTHYKPGDFPDNKIPRSVMFQDMVNFYFYGGKTFYYNTNFDADELAEELGEEKKDGGDQPCESCVI
ncbi:ribonucleoside-diphosphate reductase [Serratia phage 2050H1]|uniref:Ribonucleoside-diphosphate reductase n=1 Tax=Serratia phage 2050H1 TaxID=2024250 RepID=A0A249Y2J3_9CAUD|nr:ribonucleoside-diphosphate reductase [Serratia phage 2050H1]